MFTKNKSDPDGIRQIKLCFRWWKDRLLWHDVIIELFLSETKLTCGKKIKYTAQDIKRNCYCHLCFPGFLSTFLPAYNMEKIRSAYSLFPRLINSWYSFVLSAFHLIARQQVIAIVSV